MGFDAAKAVEPLDWDFSTLKNPGTGTPYVDAKGTIPEPTGKQVSRLFARIQRDVTAALAKIDIEADEDVPADKLLEAAEATLDETEQAASVLQDTLTAAYAEFCRGSPTKAQLGKLPFRPRMAFFRWLTEEFSPEASGAATSRPDLSIVRGA